MSVVENNGKCSAILASIAELLDPNDPAMIMTPIGGVQALLDPDNTKGVTMQQMGAGDEGHRKTVRIKYKNRAILSDIGDEKTCDAGESKPNLEDVFDVDLHSELILHYDEATIRTLCDAQSALMKIPVESRDSDGNAIKYKSIIREFGENLMMDLDAFRQKINDNFLIAYANSHGTWKGGSTSKSFTVIKDADHAVVLTGFNKFKQELKRIGAGGLPLLFGGGNIDLAFSALELGCCNNAGQDIGAMSKNAGMKFYFDDSDLATRLGNANAFGAFMPKSVQLVQFNKYVGSFARPHGLTERGTIPDPRMPGLRYDIRIIPSTCLEEGWDMYINLDYGFWFQPDVYKDGDVLEGYNGSLLGIAAAS